MKGGGHLAGSRKEIAALAHNLAQQFEKRVTGKLPAATPDEEPTPTPETPHAVPPPATPEPDDDLTPLRESGLAPASARLNALLSERDLAALVKNVAKQMPSVGGAPVTILQAAAPVSRIRALTALIRLGLSPEDVAGYREALPEQMPPDVALLPPWARPYAAAAVDRGWWDGAQPLRPKEIATWGFVAQMLQKMPLSGPTPTRTKSASNAATDEETERFTGLVIDARTLAVQRQMGPRILDEDGKVVYPDPKHTPDIDWLEDHGMADYDTDPQAAKRAGSHPLVVTARTLFGPGHDDLVVSNETAERIRTANRRTRFLSKWAVSILIAPR